MKIYRTGPSGTTVDGVPYVEGVPHDVMANETDWAVEMIHGLSEELVLKWLFLHGWSGDEAEGRKRIAKQTKHVQHAMRVLDETPVGQRVVFEGNCPSGSTYNGSYTWDGRPETRLAIARRAAELGGFNAWAAWLVRECEVFASIASAEMRTG